MAVVGLVDLGGFEVELVDAVFAGEPADVGDLVFVGADDEELPNDVRGGRAGGAPGFEDGPGAVEDALEGKFFYYINECASFLIGQNIFSRTKTNSIM